MRLARRLLDAIAVRFSVAEKRLNELRLVTAPPRLDEPIDFGHATLHASQFNPEWLIELKIEARVLFDVGAFHVGVAGFLRRLFPDAIIFAFEADPRLFKIAARNAKQFGVTVVNPAVSDRDGYVPWYATASEGAQGSMFTRRDSVSQLPAVSIPCARLDSICIERNINKIDLLHVDVEGAEYDVLIGLGDMRPPLIYLETLSRGQWTGAKSSGDVHRLLSRIGYCLAGDFRTDRLYVHYSALNI